MTLVSVTFPKFWLKYVFKSSEVRSLESPSTKSLFPETSFGDGAEPLGIAFLTSRR
jgi:hypothetical protein